MQVGGCLVTDDQLRPDRRSPFVLPTDGVLVGARISANDAVASEPSAEGAMLIGGSEHVARQDRDQPAI